MIDDDHRKLKGENMFGGRIDNSKLPIYLIVIAVVTLVVYIATCGCL